MHILKKTKYIHKNRIFKSKNAKNTAYKIQVYNNKLIDKYIESVDDGTPQKPTQSELWSGLYLINKPNVYQNYQKIINSPYTSNDAIDKMLIRNKANKDLNRIIEGQLDRVNKNLNYVEEVVGKYTIPMKEYNKFLNEQANRSVANRRQILEDVAKESNQLLVSEGLNIPSTYTYRDLDILAEQMMKESRMLSDWEEVNAINDQSTNDGKDPVYKMKKWEWTGIGKTTRHQDMQNQPPIEIDLTFTVEDENTGTIDEMLYPMDLNASYENVMGCNCDISYY